MSPQYPSQLGAQVDQFRREHRTELVTLLFTDIVGSARLKAELGDQRGLELIRDHHELVRGLLAQFKGAQEISTAGDSFFIVFARPSEGVKFALMLQARLKQAARSAPHRVMDRIGIHVGEVFIEDSQSAAKPNDFFGLQVDLAAWLMSLARADQILVTRFAFDNARQILKGEDIDGVGSLLWVSHGPYRFKGVEETVEVCEVTPAANPVLAPPADSHKAQKLSGDTEFVPGWRPAIGEVVPNTEWVLEEKLGEGGFGEVWLGRNPKLDDHHVFKFCFQADRIRSLKRELTLFRLLKERGGEHPNLVRLFDVCLEKPPYYLEEEFIAGRDLRRWAEKQGGIAQVPLEVRLEIAAQAAEALQTAHEAGIVHRDVKPGNILIQPASRAGTVKKSNDPGEPGSEITVNVKLTDFGIAQVTSPDALEKLGQSGFTQTLASSRVPYIGTQLYMAPELLAGKSASTRSDIYALGVVLYQMVVGDFERPVTTEWAEDITDPLLRDDLRHCFARDSRERFAGPGQLAEQLRALHQRRSALQAQQEMLAARERAAFRRGMLRIGMIAGLIVAIIAGLAWQVWSTAVTKSRQANRIRSATVRLTVANGLGPAKNGDWLSAGLWFAEAFLLDEEFRAGADFQLDRLTHQLRIDSVLRRSPALEQMWLDDKNKSAEFDGLGSLVLLGGTNGYMLFQAGTGKSVGRRFGEAEPWASLRPDARQAVTGGSSSNSVFGLWDPVTGMRLGELKNVAGDGPFRGKCTELRYSPDGRWILAVIADPGGRVVIWDQVSGRPQKEILCAAVPNLRWEPGERIISARFDDSGTRVVTTGTDHLAVVWDWRESRVLQVLPGHDSWVYAANFGHGHTNWLVTCSFDRFARIWDLKSGQILLRVKHEGDAIQDVQFSPDDKMFLTGGLDSTVRFWDSETGEPVPPILRDHNRVMRAVWSPDGTRVLVVSWDGVVRIWRLKSDQTLTTSADTDLSRDGRFKLRYNRDSVRLQENGSAQDTPILQSSEEEVISSSLVGGAEYALCFSRSKDPASSQPVRVQVRQLPSGKMIGVPLDYDSSWARCSSDARGERFALYGVEDGVLGSTNTPGVALWEPSRGPSLRSVAFANEYVTTTAFEPQGRRLAVGSSRISSRSGLLRIIDLDGLKPTVTLLESNQKVSHAEFSPDGQWLCAAFSDDSLDPGETRIWRMPGPDQAFAEPTRLTHLDGVLFSSFSDSSQLIATASEDQTANIWYRTNSTWQSVLRPLYCGGEVYACAFSRNSRWLATAYRTPKSQQSAGWSGQVRIWDVANSEPVTLPVAVSNKVTRLSFVANDTLLLVERWVPPAPPRRWFIDLSVRPQPAKDSLLRMELLSAQRSFLSGRAQHLPQAFEGGLSAEEVLGRASGVGPLRPLSKEDCLELWKYFSSSEIEK